MRTASVRSKSAATLVGVALAMTALTGFTTPVLAEGCGWSATAAQQARQLASVDDIAVTSLRTELQRLGFGPGSGAGCAATPATVPGDLIDLTDWYLTLPTGRTAHPDTVRPPELQRYNGSWFHLDSLRSGVVFTANAGGVTTAHSKYPRSELREMTAGKNASWSNTSGTHTMSIRQAVTSLPVAKPEVVTAQIHDGKDDVAQIRLEGTRLLAQYDDGREEVTLDPQYVLGTPYDVTIVAAGGRVGISYNGTAKVDIARSGSGWYFKTGSYIQSNTAKGDRADAVATVVLYGLSVQHSPDDPR